MFLTGTVSDRSRDRAYRDVFTACPGKEYPAQLLTGSYLTCSIGNAVVLFCCFSTKLVLTVRTTPILSR